MYVRTYIHMYLRTYIPTFLCYLCASYSAPSPTPDRRNLPWTLPQTRQTSCSDIEPTCSPSYPSERLQTCASGRPQAPSDESGPAGVSGGVTWTYVENYACSSKFKISILIHTKTDIRTYVRTYIIHTYMYVCT